LIGLKDSDGYTRDINPDINSYQFDFELYVSAIININTYRHYEIIVFYSQIYSIMCYLTFSKIFWTLKIWLKQYDKKDLF